MERLKTEADYNRLEKRLTRATKRMEKLEKRNNTLVISNSFLLALMIITTVLMGCKFAADSFKISSLKSQNESLTEEVKLLSKEFDDASNLLADVSEIAVTLDKDNETLKEDNLQLQDELNSYKEKQELYDKYDYAIYRDNGTRTDITYDNLKSLEELTKEKGMTEESNQLILSIAMTESKGVETAENPVSTATGYGQFLSSTGRFVYTELMGNDSYVHSEIAKNGETNLQMMAYYIDYLDTKYNGNMVAIIDEYRGIHDESYMGKINKYLSTKELTLASIEIHK